MRTPMPVCLLVLACLPAWAQTPAPRDPQQRSEIVIDAPLLHAANAFDVLVDTDHVAGVASGGERLVKGAPYCADALHETVQPLLDAGGAAGNRIVRQTKTRLCRDGEGRTRQEVERGGRKLVLLRDPVAREHWVLDPERKTARRSGGTLVWSSGAALDTSFWHDYAERMREWAKSMAERAKTLRPGSAPPAPTPPTPPTPSAAPRAPGEAELVVIARQVAEQAEREVEVLRLPMQGTEMAPLPPTPPAVSWTANRFAPRGEGVLTSLGGKEIEGLRVNGERTTWTIEAGKVGNEKPIQIVRDVWTSPELMLTVATRDFDPRRGETNYRLTNVKRGEPDAALMKVPADYAKPSARAASAKS
jgi:hypothetical protein